jgi:glycosidase
MLLFILVFTLSACANNAEPREIIFNIENNHTITQYEGSNFISIEGISITDEEGNDLVPFVEFSGTYDLDTPGTYEITISSTDDLGYQGSRTIILEILEKTCEMDPEQEKCTGVAVEGISINPETTAITEVFIDDFIRVNYTITPENAENKNVTFESSDPTIAAVSEVGFVFGRSEGTATITVTTQDGNFSDSFLLTVVSKSCDVDPLQDKCAVDILGDDSRIVTVGNPNISGTNYQEVYVNNKIFYQIYVRTFADSDGNLKGDFQGIIDVLPYLEDLGVGGIWLMPINQSRADHGYEVDDYYAVDDEYGTMADFDALLAASDEAGIDIIIDLVINHMGARNDMFQDVLENGIYSQWYNWFNWLDSSDERSSYTGSWGQEIWYNPSTRPWLKADQSMQVHSSLNDKKYAAYFSDWMPDLNFENSQVRLYFKQVAEFWLNKGVDGFRMDAVSHFYGLNEYFGLDRVQENKDLLTEFSTYVKTVNPDAYIVVEAWEGYHEYAQYHGSGVNAFNFQGMYDIRSAVNGGLSGTIGDRLLTLYNEFDNYDANFLDAIFISNHDSIGRIAANTGSFEDTRQAAEILLTLPGNPYIYYGDEIGMLGTRNNMVWGDYYDSLFVNFDETGLDTVSEQLLDPDSLLQYYQRLGALRTSSLALQYGDFVPYDDGYLQGYYRVFENGQDKELVVVLFNFTSVFFVPIPDIYTGYEILYATYENNLGGISPHGTMVLRLPYNEHISLLD